MASNLALTRLIGLNVKADRAATGDPVRQTRKLPGHKPETSALEQHRLFSGKAPLIVLLTDALAVIGGTLLMSYQSATSLRFPPSFASTSMVAALLALLFAYNLDAYLPAKLGSTRHRIRCGLVAVLGAGSVMIVSLALTGHFNPLWTFDWGLVAGSFFIISAVLTSAVVKKITGTTGLALSVAIVGTEAESRWLVGRLLQGGADSARLIGVYDDNWRSGGDKSLSRDIDDLLVYARMKRIDAIILAMPGADCDRIARARAILGSTMSDIFLAPKELELVAQASRGPGFHPDLLVRILSRPLTQWQMFQKTLFDRIMTPMLCLIALPIVCIAAIAIRLDSPGPILFRQVRRGAGDTTFRVFKFRTMYVHMTDPDATQQTTRNDRRVTSVGRLLRRTSLDELPQLLNVLRGEMSLVGPRPHAMNTKAGDQLFPDAVAEYRLRYRVKPGITGWAQINGWRGETRTLEQLEQRVLYDLAYIENWSVRFDIKIMLMTIWREINSKIAF